MARFQREADKYFIFVGVSVLQAVSSDMDP